MHSTPAPKYRRTDISFVYQIQGKGKYRRLVVGLSHKRARDAIYDSRKLLRNTSNSESPTIYINEHLTRMTSQLYARARSLINVKFIPPGLQEEEYSSSTLSLQENPLRVDSTVLCKLEGSGLTSRASICRYLQPSVQLMFDGLTLCSCSYTSLTTKLSDLLTNN